MIWYWRPRTILAAAATVLCALAPGISPGKADTPILGADQIRPGMMGEGRTVFRGHVPEAFQVEFLGVLKNAIGPGQDMILARLHGKEVERTGVIAGMSGSPVTLDGKLVGAISYRLGTFGKEAIAGITPIEDMLRAGAAGSGGEASARAAGGGALLEEWAHPSERTEGDGAAKVSSPAGEMVPIATPLVFSGFPEEVVRQVAPLFRARGLEPVSGGGGGGAQGTDYPIEPGVPIAVALISGDLSLAATGTLTHVEGRRIWAFGHPFLDTGSVRYPLLRAEILVTFPSSLGSFKISNATTPMGTLVQDRLTCIQGELGAPPEPLPVTIVHHSPSGTRSFSYQLARDRVLTPLLLGVATQASLQRILQYSAESTLRTELRIESEGHPPVVYSSVDTDRGGPQSRIAPLVARDVAAVFNALYSNRFQDPKVRSVRLRVEALPEERQARIGEISVTPSRVWPGGSFTVRASIQPFRGEAFVREFKVKVPPDTPKGRLMVTVASARGLNILERSLLQRRFTGASSLDELIGFLNGLRSEDTLYLQVARRTLGAVVQGEALPSLPLSMIFTLGNNRYLGNEYPAPNLPVVEDSSGTDYVLRGGRRTTIQVR